MDDVRDFEYKCIHEQSIKYRLFKDDLYLVPMTNGYDAIYQRAITKHYLGTKQRDITFKFICYEEDYQKESK